jgi:hypothetical protein
VLFRIDRRMSAYPKDRGAFYRAVARLRRLPRHRERTSLVRHPDNGRLVVALNDQSRSKGGCAYRRLVRLWRRTR